MKVPPNLRRFLTEEDAEKIEGKQAMKIDDQAIENGVGTESDATEGQASTENEQANLKERRKRLKERRKALEQARDSFDDTAEEWKSINALVQEIDKQVELLAGTPQQPQPETVYINAVRELRQARQMRNDIEEHVKELEARLANQKDRLDKSNKLVQAGIMAVEKAQRAANLSGDQKNPGDIQTPPEPQRKFGGIEPAQINELLEKLQAGAHGFITDPDARYKEYTENWELRRPEAEKLMTPVEWAMTQVAAYVVDMLPHERPAKHMRK